MRKIIAIIIWFCMLMLAWNLFGYFISAPNTIMNMIGVIVAISFLIFTVKSKCLMKLIK